MIDGIENFNDMLALPLRLGQSPTNIFEVKPPLFVRGGPLQWGMFHHSRPEDPLMVIQDLPNRAGTLGQAVPLSFQRFVTVQVVEDGSGAGGTPKIFGRMVPNLQNAFNHSSGDRGWLLLSRSGQTPQSIIRLRRRLTYSLQPFLHPG